MHTVRKYIVEKEEPVEDGLKRKPIETFNNLIFIEEAEHYTVSLHIEPSKFFTIEKS
jgi:hypothetical protein